MFFSIRYYMFLVNSQLKTWTVHRTQINIDFFLSPKKLQNFRNKFSSKSFPIRNSKFSEFCVFFSRNTEFKVQADSENPPLRIFPQKFKKGLFLESIKKMLIFVKSFRNHTISENIRKFFDQNFFGNALWS